MFAALAVARHLQDATDTTIKKLVQILRAARSATIEINGATQTFPPAIPTEQQALLDAIVRPDFTHWA